MENLKKAQKWLSKALFLLGCVITPLLLFSCASGKSVQNNTVYHDSAHTSVRRDNVNQRQSHWQDTQQHDSVFRQDSVLVYIKGDTVIKERWHNLTTTKWKTTTKTDTIVGDTYTFVTDTVKVKYYVNRYKTKEVEKPASAWHKVRLLIGDITIFFILYILFCLVKNRFNH